MFEEPENCVIGANDPIKCELNENCVICGEPNDETSVVVKAKLRSLAKCSIQSGDGNNELFESISEFRLHLNCRNRYTMECEREMEDEQDSDLIGMSENQGNGDIVAKDPVKFEHDECVICAEPHDETTIVVKERGLRTLVKFSLLRNDGIKEIFESVTEIRLHYKCRARYIMENRRGIYKPLPKGRENQVRKPATVEPNLSQPEIAEEPKNCDVDANDDFSKFDHYANCAICGEPQDETSELVRERGLRNLVRLSILRNDGNSKLFGRISVIRLHSKCRKKYTNINNHGIYNALPEGFPKEPDWDEEAQGDFDFRNRCFICERTTKKLSRGSYHEVHTSSLKDTMMLKAKNQALIARIKDVDLTEVGARYHPHCYSRIMIPRRFKKVGRAPTQQVENAMKIIFDHIDNADNNEQFSLEQLTGLLKGTGYVPDNRTLLKALSERYQDRMDISGLANQDGDADADEDTSVWSYYERDSDGGRARCAVCRAAVARTELKLHLKENHPKLVAEVNLVSDDGSDTQEDVYTEIVYLEDEQSAKKTKVVEKKKPKLSTERTAPRKRQASSSSDETPLKPSNNDEIEQFGRYVTCLLRKIPPEACIELQMDIVNLIMKKQLELKRNKTPSLAANEDKMAAVENGTETAE